MPMESEAERTEEEEGENTHYRRQFEEKSLSDSEIKVQRKTTVHVVSRCSRGLVFLKKTWPWRTRPQKDLLVFSFLVGISLCNVHSSDILVKINKETSS